MAKKKAATKKVATKKPAAKKVATPKKAAKATVKKAATKKVASPKKASVKKSVAKKVVAPKKKVVAKKGAAKKPTQPAAVAAPKKAASKKETPKKAEKKVVAKKEKAPKAAKPVKEKAKKEAEPKKEEPAKKSPAPKKKVAPKAAEKTVSRRAVVVEQKEKVKKPPVSIREGSKDYRPKAPTNIRTIKNTDGKILGHRPTHELNAVTSKKKAVDTKKKRKSILGTGDDDGAFMRYSDSDLAHFRKAISEKLEKARTELKYLQGLITRKDESGTEDTENPYASMEDGSMANQREQLNQMAGRQINFINNLEKALIRISNKTYGICRETGTLISKKRLMAVPHATLSKDAKDARR